MRKSKKSSALPTAQTPSWADLVRKYKLAPFECSGRRYAAALRELRGG